MKNLTLLALSLLLVCTSASAQTIYYVNFATGSNSNPGTSWTLPFRDITKALAVAQGSSAAEVDIWVAASSYSPIDGIAAMPADHRDTSFAIYRGTGVGKALKLYGGFVGTETSISERDTLHTTYMEGAYSGGAVYHVGVVAGLAATADSVVIDGFTIRHGQGDSAGTKTFNGVTIARVYGAGLVMKNNLSGKVAIRNCKIRDNNISSHAAQSFGAGIYFSSSSATIDSSSFTNNIAGDYYATSGICDIRGGAIYATASQLALSGCHFDGNECYLQRPADMVATGGAIEFDVCTNPVLTNCTFISNQCTNDDPVLYLAGGAICNSNSNTHFSHCSFNNNKAYDNYLGGLSSSTISAGAIFNRSSTVTIDTCIFNNNEAGHYWAGNPGNGGAVYDSFSTVTYTLDTFNGNFCSGGYGGGVACDRSTDHISNCMFNENVCAYGGGSVSIANNSTAWINNVYSLWSEGENGGHIYNSANSTLHASNDTLWGAYTTSGGDNGGGIYSESPQLYVRHCLFQYTHCSTNGGGICCTQTPMLIDSCDFYGNQAGWGGAIFTDNNVSLTPMHCTFRYNTASSDGGGICFTGPDAIGSAVLKSDGNVFDNNTGQEYGGAVAAYSKYTHTFRGFDTLTNNIFATNQCSGGPSATAGGAVYAPGSTHFIANNTFATNVAPVGGAIASDGTLVKMSIYNNVFFQGIAFAAWGTTTRDTSLRGTGIYYAYNNIFTGTNPQFVDSTSFSGADGIWQTDDDGLALTNCSPAVNAGDNSYVTATEFTDVRGTVRIMAGRVDIGAYEAVTIGNITGPDSICAGASISYTDTSAGGTWTSADPTVATVGSTTGIVTGVATGTTIIYYSHAGACATPDMAIRTITVVAPPAIVTGASTLCVSATITLTDSISGGSWSSSSPSVASINSATGVVTAISAGTVTLSYNVVNACGTYHMLKVVTVNGLPALATISGAASVCVGDHVTLSSSLSGGTWSTVTGNASVAGTGVVTGVTAGIDTVKYTLTNSCGSKSGIHLITVHNISYCDSIASLSASADQMEGDGISVYPNPAHDAVTIVFGQNNREYASLVLTNMAGEKVREFITNNTKTVLSLSKLPEGIYILSAKKGQHQYYRRIVIQ